MSRRFPPCPDPFLKCLGISRMNLDTEETRETHNFYIESIRGSFKNIKFICNLFKRFINPHLFSVRYTHIN